MRLRVGPCSVTVATAMTLSCSLLVSTSDLSGGTTAGAGDSAVPTDAAPPCDADTRSDLDNCGACGTRCLTRANGFPACNAGACETKCNATFGDCDGNAANGCEASLGADGKNCGACGHDCGGGLCVDGACRAVTLVNAGGAAQTYTLATDGAAVYYTSAKNGGVYRCAATGCEAGPQQVGFGNERAYFLAVDATQVYWNNNSTNGQTQPGQVLGCAKGGGALNTVFTKGPALSAANPTQVAIDADSVYWSSNEGTIWRASKQPGSSPTALTKVTNSANLHVQGGVVYIASDDDNAVYACPVGGCSTPPPRLVSADQPAAGDVAGDGTTVFWTRSDGVYSLTPGGTPNKLASSTSSGRIAVDGNDVFWTDGPTKVRTVPKAGGVARDLATNQTGITDIAADAKFVYWVSSADGVIYKLAR